jgi:hypothetical protein
MDQMDQKSDVLDTSWINDVKKEIDIHKNYDKEPCDEINTIFIFVDIENNIHKINSSKEIISTIADNRVITKERLIQIIESKKRENPKIKYRLTDVLLYCNEIDSDDICTYAKTDNMDEEGLKVLSIFNDTIIPQSIFIFHSINAIYFIFKQVKDKSYSSIHVSVKKKENNIKSILKTKTAKSKQSGEHNITKKVDFNDECSLIPNQNITKKKYDDDVITISEIDADTEHNRNTHNKTQRL